MRFNGTARGNIADKADITAIGFSLHQPAGNHLYTGKGSDGAVLRAQSNRIRLNHVMIGNHTTLFVGKLAQPDISLLLIVPRVRSLCHQLIRSRYGTRNRDVAAAVATYGSGCQFYILPGMRHTLQRNVAAQRLHFNIGPGA